MTLDSTLFIEFPQISAESYRLGNLEIEEQEGYESKIYDLGLDFFRVGKHTISKPLSVAFVKDVKSTYPKSE